MTPPREDRLDAASAELTSVVLEGLQVIDDAFARAASALGPAVPCRRGCSSCCVAIFDVHPADALLLGAWLDSAHETTRQDVLDRARSVLREAETARERPDMPDSLAHWRPEDGLSGLDEEAIEALAHAVTSPCPVLGPEGECRAHAMRPAICRLQGLPWRDETSGEVVPDFCRLDARQAGLPAQPFHLGALDALRWRVRDEAAVRHGAPLPRGRTFVAEALVRWARASDAPAAPPPSPHGMLPPA